LSFFFHPATLLGAVLIFKECDCDIKQNRNAKKYGKNNEELSRFVIGIFYPTFRTGLSRTIDLSFTLFAIDSSHPLSPNKVKIVTHNELLRLISHPLKYLPSLNHIKR
jgi:hypothetical protein